MVDIQAQPVQKAALMIPIAFELVLKTNCVIGSMCVEGQMHN